MAGPFFVLSREGDSAREVPPRGSHASLPGRYGSCRDRRLHRRVRNRHPSDRAPGFRARPEAYAFADLALGTSVPWLLPAATRSDGCATATWASVAERPDGRIIRTASLMTASRNVYRSRVEQEPDPGGHAVVTDMACSALGRRRVLSTVGILRFRRFAVGVFGCRAKGYAGCCAGGSGSECDPGPQAWTA